MSNHLPINILELLRQRRIESERIEYKAGWNPDPIVRTICAFANDLENLGGGYIVIGQDCDENGKPIFPPVGLAETELDKIQQELLGHCKNIEPYYFPILTVETIDDRKLIVLQVPGGPNRPYKAPAHVTAKHKSRHYYIRRYTSTIEAEGEDEQRLVALTNKTPFDDQFHPHARIHDLSPELMQGFLQGVNSRLAEDAPDMPLEALGRQMNVIGDMREVPHVKNVGLLFFNEAPEQYFPLTQIDVVWFPEGPGGDFFEEKVFKGPLSRMAHEALDHIKRNYLREMVIKYPDRAESRRVFNFPYPAVEEALMNAIYHRAYDDSVPIEVRITHEELGVLSFPGPDRAISLDKLKNGQAVNRRYRNRRIGDFLKELDLTEGRATGIPKILKAMAQNGSPLPIFETDDERTSFFIRLPVQPVFLGAQPAPSINESPPMQAKLYGRDALLKTTAAKLQQHSLLLVFGMRGIGKTRFIDILATQAALAGEAVRIQAEPNMNADGLFRQFAWALGETADFPLAPVGEIDAIAKEFKRRYPNPRAGWLWLDRAHVLLGKDGFALPEVRKLLLGLQKAYGKTWPIVLELRERPPKGLLGVDALECEVPGLDKDALGQALADAAPEGMEADWCLKGDQLKRVYGWLGGGGGKQAHPLALSFLIEVGRALHEAPIAVLARQEVTGKIETALLGDLINKVLNPAERHLIQALALYRKEIPHDHADSLEDQLNLPNAWDGINKRCLLTSGSQGTVFYLHGFIADWLRVGLGYQANDNAGQAEFAHNTPAYKVIQAQRLHGAVAACWLKQLGGSRRTSQVNIDRALEAFFHLTAGAQGDRIHEIAIDLLGGNEGWAIQRIEKLANDLFQIKTPVIERRKVLEYWAALAPHEPKAWRFLGETWAREEGWASASALHCFEQACKINPVFPNHWANLGKCLLAQGEAGAKTFLLRLAVLAQDYPQAIDNHVIAVQLNCLVRVGEQELASQLRMEKIQAGSLNPGFYADEAKAHLNAGDALGALQILDLAQQRHCTDEVTDAIRSSALAASGQTGAADALRMEKINEGSRNPVFYNAQAQALLAANDAAGALALLDLAQQRGCADDYTAKTRAKVLQRLNRPA